MGVYRKRQGSFRGGTRGNGVPIVEVSDERTETLLYRDK